MIEEALLLMLQEDYRVVPKVNANKYKVKFQLETKTQDSQQ
jgi:hypothetical protein